MGAGPRSPFLTAQWRHVAMANFEVDPALLRPLLPDGTELDDWQGRHLVSIVGFLFLNTRVMGLPIPFHQRFEEVNLRFYVRRKHGNEWRRGVAFVREIVPRSAVSLIARTLYGEPYITLPMQHRLESSRDGAHEQLSVTYSCIFRGRESRMTLRTQSALAPLVPGSNAEFITEHYWGYTRRGPSRTDEYRVEHPRWLVAAATVTAFNWDVHGLYGPAFGAFLGAAPASALLADGSEVRVHRGTRLPQPQARF